MRALLGSGGLIPAVRQTPRTLGRPAIPEHHPHQPGGVGDGPVAGAFSIQRVFPVPARNTVTIEFTLAESATMELDVHDVRGRRVRTIPLGTRTAGPHAVLWDGRTDAGERAGAGVYFARLRTPRADAVARVVRVE